MKTKMVLLLTFLFAATFSTFAQRQMQTVEERVKTVMDKLSPLNLNKEQQVKTQTVFTDYYTSMQKVMQDARSTGQRPDRSVFEKATSDRNAALKNIFTDDQYKKFKDELEETLRPQRRNNQ